ncbi:hypothetical protein MAM1_0961c11388 [Mucor ambiguus]|uniref:Uncharacterized protein n=1 Tax=Mucor ambiguus TaxID=91626 RepID=A0A0C9NAJ5_9FUNG|nr:hypothetical protein MAM1_0961c11388 [Mucor ambiguus]
MLSLVGKKLLLFAAAVAVYLLIVLVLRWSLLLRLSFTCCFGDALLSGNLVLFAAAAVVVCLLYWCGLGACFRCLLSFICCLAAVYCCCYCSLIVAVLVMHSLGKLAQFSAAVVAVYLLSWRLLCVRFCYCCCSFAVLALSAAGVIIWDFWFVLCFVDVPIAEAQHYFIRGWG